MSRGYIRIELMIIVFILFLSAIILGLAFSTARVEARDKIRITDAAQIQKVLSIYFQENGVYPSAEDGHPIGMDNYLEHWPTAPKADGNCSETQNRYFYAQKFSGEDYIFTFCLGKTNSNVAPGFNTLTAKGIK